MAGICSGFTKDARGGRPCSSGGIAPLAFAMVCVGSHVWPMNLALVLARGARC